MLGPDGFLGPLECLLTMVHPSINFTLIIIKMNSTDPLNKLLSYACFTELPLTMKTVLNSNLGQSHFGWLCLTMYANKNLREKIILCVGVFISLPVLFGISAELEFLF